MNIAILGTGVMGRVLCLELLKLAENAQKPIHLSLFDKNTQEQQTSPSYTAAGMLTPFCELETAEHLVFEMGIHALPLWREISNLLNNKIGFQQRGSLVVSHQADKPDYMRFIQQLRAKLGDSLEESVSFLDTQALGRICPSLQGSFQEAIYIASEAALNSQDFMQASGEYIRSSKAKWHASQNVQDLASHQAGASFRANGKKHEFDLVFDTRGLGAKENLPDLRGVRGELIWLEAPEVHISQLVRLMHPRYKLYLVPRGNGIYIIGASQIESEDAGPISLRSSLELLSAVYSLDSRFAESRILKTDTNLRPALPNNLPSIRINGNIIHINGLFRHGYLLSPSLAEAAVQHVFSNHKPSPFFKGTSINS